MKKLQMFTRVRLLHIIKTITLQRLVSCKCCGEGVPDVKYPGKFCMQKVEGEWSLKRDHLTLLVFKLHPHYPIPFFSQQEIPRLYTKVKESVVDPKLTEIEHYSATTDLWTSRAIQPYLSYTVHFINHNWDLKSFCLETIPLFDDHTGANISESIADIMTNC